jgi:uncharacterized repeat protein (TIGR03803 family)
MKAEHISKELRVARIVGRLIFSILTLLPAVLLTSSIAARADVAFTSLYSFDVLTNGGYPNSLAKGIDGNLYGTTSSGGPYGFGTVLKITTNGALTRLYFFTGGADGEYPYAGLAQGSDRNFYGTTGHGGTYGYGTVFKITTNGILTRLYSFTGGNDGADPEAAVAQGSDGNLYGTTYRGGAFGHGGVFKITTNGAFSRLYSFTGGSDGANPYSALVQGSDGNFYGTAGYGGTNDFGTLFKITTGGVFTRLHLFTGGDDGSNPNGGLTPGSDGSFYGTANQGGTDNQGTVFKITANGDFTRLYSFTGGVDGGDPESVLAQGADGNFYGTTLSGGDLGEGVAFQITADGVYTRLYSFTSGNDGAYPVGVLVQGNDGNFYGTASGGAFDSRGSFFKITTNGVLSTLYTFTGNHDGQYPYSPLVQGGNGNLYGTTYSGGTIGDGVIFRISASGVATNLYSFMGGSDGFDPQPGLVQGSDGNLYGETYGSSPSGFGTVFRVTTNGVFTTLHTLVFLTEGGGLDAALTQGKDGNLYGTAASGGTNGGYGTVFRITTNGVLTSLHSFTGDDGANPYASVMQGSDGLFYGTTGYGGTNNQGTVFKVTTNGEFTSLYSFTGGNDGANPYAGLAQASNGVLYGVTLNGGTNRIGSVFKITTNGAFCSLYSFTGGDDGGYPYGTLLLAKNGHFYGTTYYGININSAGSVFKITTNGAVTGLYSFTGGNDGGSPQAGLVLGTDGSLYGTTSSGGAGNAGTVFRITIAPAFKAFTLTNRTLNLTWSAEPGSKYQLQYNSDLSPGNWLNLGSPLTSTGATLSATDPLANNPRRFYRILLLPQ